MNFFQFSQKFPARKPGAFLYAVSGDQLNLRDETISRIRSHYKVDEIDHRVVVARNQAQALDALEAPSVGVFKLVEISDFEDWNDRTILEQWLLTRRQSTTVAIFVTSKKDPKRDSLFAKTIVKKGWWVACSRPSRETLEKWLEVTYSLPPDLAGALIDSAGLDLFRVQNAIRRLALYTRGKKPTIRDLKEITSGHYPSSYSLVDAIIAGDKPQAVALAREGMKVGSLLRHRIGTLMQVRASVARREQLAEISARVGVPVYSLTSLLAQAKSLPVRRMAAMLDGIGRMEVAVAAGMDPVVALRRLIITV
jgi:DNA polymerase III delta subunit